MKGLKLSVGVLFLILGNHVLVAQSTTDTIKSNDKVIEEVRIQGSAKRTSESNIIAVQRKSAEIVERVGSVQLAKQGVGDVATAVTKATGVVSQDGDGIFVRGLGDRYNTTTLNGFIIPSHSPENKNIDLGIFKTNMIDFISLEKVFSPRLNGDFAGANVNIVSKEYVGKPYFKIGIGSSVNTQTYNQSQFKRQDGNDFFGFKKNTLPRNPNPVKQYAFRTSWDMQSADNPFSTSINAETGASFNVGTEGRISLFAYAGFDNDYSYRKGQENNVSAVGNYLKRLDVERSTYSTNTTGLINLVYKINARNKVSFVSNYIHTADQDVRVFRGYMMDNAENGKGLIQRADNVTTTLWINQLFGEHQFNKDWTLNWGAAYNDIKSERPNRMQNTMTFDDSLQQYTLVINSPADQHRYFDDMIEKNYLGNLSVSKKWSDRLKLTLGLDGQYKNRDFGAVQINLRAKQANTVVDPNNLDWFFNASSFNNGRIELSTLRGLGESDLSNLLLPLSYKSEQKVVSGFANLDLQINDRLSLQAGLRNDYINMLVSWNTNVGESTGKVDRDYNKILPVLNLKYKLTENQNLRLAASKTYTLPQSKEMAPFAYVDVTNTTYGQSKIYPSDNYNADLKWEVFPNKDEVFSLAAYGKYIQNPISRVNVASASANDLTYVNAGDWGYAYGLEAEMRKNIFKTENGSKLYTILNASVMNSKQELNFDKVRSETGIATAFTKNEEQLTGASNFIGNASLGWSSVFSKDQALDIMVVYGYVGKNVFAYGTNEKGSQIMKGLNLLDVNASFKFNKSTSLTVFGKNLINPNYTIDQENGGKTYILNQYNRGKEVGISISHQF